MRAPVGMKIRRQRQEKGLSQAALAKAAGISPSYLNLIENNRRDVGGALLLRIARSLDLAVEELSGAREQKVLQSLTELPADPVLSGIPLGQTDLRDLVARFPEIALSLLRLQRAQSETGAELDLLADRFSSDPVLAEMLHEALNRVTGLRSGAEILAETQDLSESERHRFTATIAREARELSRALTGLTGYFDQASTRRRGLSPVREVEEAVIAADNHFPELEAEALRLRGTLPSVSEAGLALALETRFGFELQRGEGLQRLERRGKVIALRSSDPQATRVFQLARALAEAECGDLLGAACEALNPGSDESRSLARSALSSYLAGALLMPYEPFLAAAEAHGYDIDLLSHAFGASFEQAAHRLVTLRRPGAEGVPFGFLRADPSGRLTKRFPVQGLSWPGGGHGCPLWPLYRSSSLPGGGVIRQITEFPNGRRFLMIAKSVPKRIPRWQDQPLTFSIMLACDLLQAGRTVYGAGLDLSPRAPALPVGPACALCPRAACPHRQDSAALTPA